MLTKIIGAPFTSERCAKTALTACRKKYRTALRGAVVIEDNRAFYVHLPLGGTGYSVNEWAGNLRSVNGLTRREQELLKRGDLSVVRVLLETACAASRDHSDLTARALAEYGDQGPQISGIIRDHFPNDVKDKLRQLAHAVTRYTDEAYELRPRGVRLSTMRDLAGAVAATHGSGFYGPRP